MEVDESEVISVEEGGGEAVGPGERSAATFDFGSSGVM